MHMVGDLWTITWCIVEILGQIQDFTSKFLILVTFDAVTDLQKYEKTQKWLWAND